MADNYIAPMALILAAMMVSSPGAEALSCGQVVSYVSPCVKYLRSAAESCCGGVRNLNKAASTTAEQRNVCDCLVSTAGKVKGLKPNLVSALPSACGVSLPFKFSASTNWRPLTGDSKRLHVKNKVKNILEEYIVSINL